jgi:hypothetical protein
LSIEKLKSIFFMKNFESIFFNIKKYFVDNYSTSNVDLKHLENKIIIKEGRYTLQQYLGILADLGYIIYNKEKNTVTLTVKGRNADKLFTIDPA